MTAVASDRLVRACSLAELRAAGRQVVHLNGHVLCLFAEGEEVYAVDNRCPHMGFPLHRGSVCDGILTCHWHHARFDLGSGGTFDQWADDLRAYPVEVRDGQVLVDLAPQRDELEHRRRRLREGLARASARFGPDHPLTQQFHDAIRTFGCEEPEPGAPVTPGPG